MNSTVKISGYFSELWGLWASVPSLSPSLHALLIFLFLLQFVHHWNVDKALCQGMLAVYNKEGKFVENLSVSMNGWVG